MSPGWRRLTAPRVINFTPLWWLARDSNWGWSTIIVPCIIIMCFSKSPNLDYSTNLITEHAEGHILECFCSQGATEWSPRVSGTASIWAGDRIELCGPRPVKCNKESKAERSPMFSSLRPELHITHTHTHRLRAIMEICFGNTNRRVCIWFCKRDSPGWSCPVNVKCSSIA